MAPVSCIARPKTRIKVAAAQIRVTICRSTLSRMISKNMARKIKTAKLCANIDAHLLGRIPDRGAVARQHNESLLWRVLRYVFGFASRRIQRKNGPVNVFLLSL